MRRVAEIVCKEEEATPGRLLDIVVGWFGAAEATELAKAQDGPLREWKLQRQFDALKASNEGPADEELLRQEARKSMQVRRWLMDAAALQIPEPHRGFVITAKPQDGPSLAEIDELLGQIRDDFKASEREASHLATADILPESLRRAAWPILLDDTGWRCLAIDEATDRMPEARRPEVDRLIRAWVGCLPLYDRGSVNTLQGSLDLRLLWPRYDRTLLRAQTGEPVAANQLKRLQDRLTLQRMVEIEIEPSGRLIPAEVVQAKDQFWQKFESICIDAAGGYVLPVCSTEPPEIKCRCGRINLPSHQSSPTRRLIAIRRGLLG